MSLSEREADERGDEDEDEEEDDEEEDEDDEDDETSAVVCIRAASTPPTIFPKMLPSLTILSVSCSNPLSCAS